MIRSNPWWCIGGSSRQNEPVWNPYPKVRGLVPSQPSPGPQCGKVSWVGLFRYYLLMIPCGVLVIRCFTYTMAVTTEKRWNSLTVVTYSI